MVDSSRIKYFTCDEKTVDKQLDQADGDEFHVKDNDFIQMLGNDKERKEDRGLDIRVIDVHFPKKHEWGVSILP